MIKGNLEFRIRTILVTEYDCISPIFWFWDFYKNAANNNCIQKRCNQALNNQ